MKEKKKGKTEKTEDDEKVGFRIKPRNEDEDNDEG